MPVVKGTHIGCRCHGACLFARNGSAKNIQERASFPLGNLIYSKRAGRGRLKLSDVSNQMPFTRYEDVSPRWKLSCECATGGSDKSLIVCEIFLSTSNYNIHLSFLAVRPSPVPFRHHSPVMASALFIKIVTFHFPSWTLPCTLQSSIKFFCSSSTACDWKSTNVRAHVCTCVHSKKINRWFIFKIISIKSQSNDLLISRCYQYSNK